MCLITKQKEPKIATKDIVVYKWLEKSINGHIETPYQYKRIKIGKTYTSLLKNYGDSVEEGLHTFKLKKDAIKDSSQYKNNYGQLIVKCIIPKESKYFTGDYNAPAFASDKLTYIKIVKIL